MSWLEENYSDKFDLGWWRVAFDMAAKALFASIDQLTLQDVQVQPSLPCRHSSTHTLAYAPSHRCGFIILCGLDLRGVGWVRCLLAVAGSEGCAARALLTY